MELHASEPSTLAISMPKRVLFVVFWIIFSACRIFFFRHYSDNFPTLCEASSNCEISYKNKRKNCSACRYKRCLQANMSRSEECKSLWQTQQSYAPMQKLLEMYGEIMNNGFKIIENLKDCRSATEWIDRLHHTEVHLFSLNGNSPSTVSANTQLSLLDIVMFPGSSIDRSTRAFDIFSDPNPSVSYKMMETLVRIAVVAVENLSLIEEFHLLPTIDKMKLVQQNASMVTACIYTYVRYTRGWDCEVILKYLNRFKIGGNAGSTWKSTCDAWTAPSVSNPVFQKMSEIEPTEKEMMILRLRCLFLPCTEHSDEGLPIIIKARLKLAILLGEYIRESYPHFTDQEVQKRLCQILELEDFMKNSVRDFNKAMLRLTVHEAGGLGTPLAHDMFVRNL